MFKTTLKFVFGSLITYFVYCFTRGFVWGLKNTEATPKQRADFAIKVTRFQG